MKQNPLLLTDFYKVGHPAQYPKNTTLVYSNLTPRKSRIDGVNEMVFFGLQYFIKEYLIEQFSTNFFERDKEVVMSEYKRRVVTSLGSDLPSYDHIEKLWDLGYLPIEIKALPEGSLVPMRVPCITIVNTLPEFYWLTNFMETLLSASAWQACTSATIAHEYKKILTKWAVKTGMPMEFIQWQGHDFSFRGMSSLETAVLSGMGHLLSFTGTDTIPAIAALEEYYNANANNELIGGSVAATEHSVMCAGAKDSEIDTFKRLITEVYPSGIVSIVSDTWDLWKVCTEYLSELKDIILARDGKVVIRPDSGDPVEIICGKDIPEFETNQDADRYFRNNLKAFNVFKDGDKYFEVVQHSGTDFKYIPYTPTPADLGVVELLWNVFGGTYTSEQYKLLDSHIGAIYGDSITTKRADEICARLEKKGFASQVVFGIGSYTYQYNTRDTFGTAMKATYVVIDNEGRNIFKDPITDDGTKKSATGLLCVDKRDGRYELTDQVTEEHELDGALQTVFKDGQLIIDQSLAEIRSVLNP